MLLVESCFGQHDRTSVWFQWFGWLLTHWLVNVGVQCLSLVMLLNLMDHLIFDMVYERFNISFYLLRNKLLMSFILCISSNFLLILFLHWNILFKDWLEKHGDFQFIVDGANIGLYQQNFADGGFSVSQVVHSICVGFLPPSLPPLLFLSNHWFLYLSLMFMSCKLQ